MVIKIFLSIFVFILFSNSYSQVFSDTVQVRFSEWMDTTGFKNPDNFVWNNGLVTLDVRLADTAMAILNVSEPIINVVYTVEVFNVYDLAGNLINPERDTTTRSWHAVPVELSLFTYRLADNIITLIWKTETEVNNYGFEIERDDIKIGFAEGHGNSNSPKHYSFIDTIQITGTYKYRLKQIDTDGKYEYSEYIFVHIMSEQTFAIYPNPTRRNFKIVINSKELEKIIRIYTILGELVLTYKTSEHVIYVSDKLSSGTYLVVYNNRDLNTTESFKLMVIK